MFSVLAEARRFSSKILQYLAPVHLPLNEVKSSCTLSRETASKQNVSTSMFDSGDGVLGVIFSISLPPNTASQVDAKELNLGLI